MIDIKYTVFYKIRTLCLKISQLLQLKPIYIILYYVYLRNILR